VNVISKRGLMKLAKKHPASVEELTEWYKVATKPGWNRLEDVRKDFRTADQIGVVLVFDIAWNSLRLITTVEYPTKRIFVKALLTHKEHDRKQWMKWAKH
jgi:mRNA interferase HigB